MAVPVWTKMMKMLMESSNQTRKFLDGYSRVLPQVHILPATNGFNHSEVIHHLLSSRVPFLSLSNGGKKWGKLATFLTKFRALQYQVDHRLPFLLLMEDDLVLSPTAFLPYIRNDVCPIYDRSPNVTIMQLDNYAEVLLTSLAGARLLIERVRDFGIRRNDDQQLLDGRIMGGGIRVLRKSVKFLPKDRPRPWRLGRATNHHEGHIYRTRRITWAEMALLRALTHPPSRALTSFGNPAFTDYLVD